MYIKGSVYITFTLFFCLPWLHSIIFKIEMASDIDFDKNSEKWIVI